MTATAQTTSGEAFFRRAFDPATMSWVFDEDALEMLIEAIGTGVRVVMDLENTCLNEFAWLGGPLNGGYPARVVLASLTIPQADDEGDPTTWVVPLSHPESPWLGRWRSVFRSICVALLEAEVPFENHNIKYDARWARAQVGVDLVPAIAWDTRISTHLLDENHSSKLKDVCPAVFNVERWDDFDLTTPGAAERVPLFELGTYAARDTYWTWRKGEYDRELMFLSDSREEPETPEDVENARLGKLSLWVAMPTVATLTAIEQRGIVLDVDWTRDRLAQERGIFEPIKAELAHLYERDPGIEVDPDRPEVGRLDPANVSFHSSSHWFQAWTRAAVEAGDLQVSALTPSGQPQWSKGVLKRQARRGSEVAQKLLDYRGAAKRAEYLTSWLGFATQEGRIHSTYNAGTVVTGRLSSSDPNLQQVTYALRPAFVPSPGFYLANLDYSQIEMRSAAHVSGCQPMIDAFNRGDDLHRLFAQRIMQVKEDNAAKREGRAPRTIEIQDVTPDERQGAKAGNFGLLYAMGPYGFMYYAEDVYDVVLTLEEATMIHRSFFEMWEGMADWHAKVIRRVHATGQVVSPLGRVRRLPGVHDGNDKVVAFAERAAINSPVQGFASDMMQIAAASIEGTLPGSSPVRGVQLIGTVHDSILVEVPIDGWREKAEECRARMIGVTDVLKRLDCELSVPLAADIQVGTRWGLSDIGEM